MRFTSACCSLLVLLISSPALYAAELVSVTPETYDEFVPDGKETDAIYGDYVLRNDDIVAVIADPIPSRKANMMIRFSGGQLIDLTTRRLRSDQLGSFYAGPVRLEYAFDSVSVDGAIQHLRDRYDVSLRGNQVGLTVTNRSAGDYPASRVTYSVADGDPYLTIETVFTNDSSAPLVFSLQDHIRMDQSGDKTAIAKAPDEVADRFWLYDPWFGQAYTIVADGMPIAAKTGADGRAASVLRYETGTPDGAIKLAPGESHRLVRRVIPGATLLESNTIAAKLKGSDQKWVTIRVKDSQGRALAGAEIDVLRDASSIGFGRTRADGSLQFAVPAGVNLTARVSSLGSGEAEIRLAPTDADAYDVTLPAAGFVMAEYRDDRGARVPCKIQFYGRNGTRDPFFGPDSGIYGVHNVVYTPDGRAEQPLPPGKYDVIVSYGPEYDAIFDTIEIKQGEQTRISGELKRVVDTTRSE